MNYNNSTYWQQLVGNNMSLREVGWPQWTEAFNKARYDFVRTQTANTLNKYFSQQQPISILELGCGVGFWTHFLQQQYPNAVYTGVDISANAIRQLKQRYTSNPKLNFVEADFSKPYQSTEKYNLVLCMEVLLHITDDAAWRQALRNLCAVLADDGYLVLSEPFLLYAATRATEHNNKIRSFKDFETIFAEYNLQVQHIAARTFLLDNNSDFKYKLSAVLWRVFFKFWHRLLRIQSEPLGSVLGSISKAIDRIALRLNPKGNGSRLLIVTKLK